MPYLSRFECKGCGFFLEVKGMAGYLNMDWIDRFATEGLTLTGNGGKLWCYCPECGWFAREASARKVNQAGELIFKTVNQYAFSGLFIGVYF